MIDADDLDEALHSAATAGMRFNGPRERRDHISHAARATRGLRRQLKLFLAELPGDATIEDLRELLDRRRDRHDDIADDSEE